MFAAGPPAPRGGHCKGVLGAFGPQNQPAHRGARFRRRVWLALLHHSGSPQPGRRGTQFIFMKLNLLQIYPLLTCLNRQTLRRLESNYTKPLMRYQLNAFDSYKLMMIS